MRRAAAQAKKPCPDCGRYVHTDFCPPHRRLVCHCGGSMVLGGEPAPTYTCTACNRVVHSLFDLAVAA